MSEFSFNLFYFFLFSKNIYFSEAHILSKNAKNYEFDVREMKIYWN